MQPMSVLSRLGRHTDSVSILAPVSRHALHVPSATPLKDVPAAIMLSLLGLPSTGSRSTGH